MGFAVAVASGSGGAGKTTVAARLAEAFARAGERTLLWELTPGTRGCDRLLGADGVCYDLEDLLMGACLPQEACLQVRDNLRLLPAPLDYSVREDAPEVCGLGGALVRSYDAVVLDLGCGGPALRVAARADLVLFCCTPDRLSADACDRAARYAAQVAGGRLEAGLAVNRVPQTPAGRAALPVTLPELIDSTGLPLLAVLPESPRLNASSGQAGPLAPDTPEAQIFDALVQRCRGAHIPLRFR